MNGENTYRTRIFSKGRMRTWGKMKVYKRSFYNVLNFSMTAKDQLGICLNWRNATQYSGDRCSWFGFGSVNGMSTVDTLMSSSYSGPSNTAIAAANTPSDFPFPLISARVNCKMRNATTQDCKVTIYKCTLKRRDIPIPYSGDPAAANPVGLNPRLLMDTLNAIQKPSTNMTDVANHYPHFKRTYDLQPWNSPQWANLFNTRKIKSLTLLPGTNWSFTFGIGGRVFKKDEDCIDSANTGEAVIYGRQTYANAWCWMRKLGPVILIKVEGTLTHKASLEGASMDDDNLRPQMGTYMLDCFFEWDYRFLHAPTASHTSNGNKLGYINQYDQAYNYSAVTTDLQQVEENAPAEMYAQ